MSTSLILAASWLVAQRHNWERMGDKFSGDNARFQFSDIGWMLVFVAGALLLLWWLSVVTKRFEGYTSRPSPNRLFSDLCRAHKLNRSQRSLLRRLAESAGVEHPVSLFVHADKFDSALLPDDTSAIAELRARLFE